MVGDPTTGQDHEIDAHSAKDAAVKHWTSENTSDVPYEESVTLSVWPRHVNFTIDTDGTVTDG